MSDLDLKEFHSFLEQLIKASSGSERFSADKVISTVVNQHADRVTKIQEHVNRLGLLALIRNNCRAKISAANSEPDLFGYQRLSKLVSVRYLNENGKVRWDKRRRSELLIDEFDQTLERLINRPAKKSQMTRDFENIAELIRPYRNIAKSIGEALEMAQRDGRLIP